MATGQTNAEILNGRSPTLTAAHEQPFLVHPKIAGTLCASGAGLSRPAGMKSELDFCIVNAGSNIHSSDLIVRRLTPTEAERLMGCEDGWTEHGADGRTISDTKRYQMLGNGVVAPCVAYIMQGIYQVLERNG